MFMFYYQQPLILIHEKQQELLKKREREVKEALDKKAERVKILEKEFGKDSDIMKKILEEEFGFHEIN